MGGKVWSKREEAIFWLILAILFPPGLHQETKGVKKGRSDIHKSWEPFPEMMNRYWREKYPGEDPPRKYTAVSMYEHYFQNFVQGKLSPNAKPFVEEYKARLKKAAENPKSSSDNEEPESRELSIVSESSEQSVPESTKAKESEPSETAVSIPTSAISQQSARQQIACEAPPPPNCRPIMLPCQAKAQAQEPWEKKWQKKLEEIGKKRVSYDHGSQERPGKRLRTMGISHHDINMSAPKGLPNQHDMPAEQNANDGDQFTRVPPAHMSFQNQNRMPVQQNANGGDQFAGFYPAHMGFQNHNGPPHNNWHQFNMVATYPGPTTGHHGSQNSTDLFIDHNGTQVNYRGVTGPGLVQNDSNSFISHGAEQSSHSTVNGRGDAQKRKRSDL
ncbi:hypothetical protein INS49_014435 [Diaporthe citri]|uniref:uncharacterized protein n=1 Tax=Diaporthe citri TaxID=83186 RepID=UPI001C800CE5|nr:uncharacterized protein INS49_014435 [Diaporthe citri]KAG6356562.1 hypothetical protein INS49_014435 [Diaporthe citri]